MKRTIIAAAALAVLLARPTGADAAESNRADGLPGVCNKTWVSGIMRAGALSPHPQFRVLRKVEIVRAHYAPSLGTLYIVLRRAISGADLWVIDEDEEIIKFLGCLAAE